MASERFTKKKSARDILQRITPILFSVLVLVIFYFSVSSLSASATDEQKKNLESTLRRGIMQCYALEGSYPESLDYLLNNYPIYYNENSFYIDYQIIGQNIYPSVSVIKKNIR